MQGTAPAIDYPGARIPEQEHQQVGQAIQQSVAEATGQPAPTVIPTTADTPVQVSQNIDKIIFNVPDHPATPKPTDHPDSWLYRLWIDIRSLFKAVIRIAPSNKALEEKITYVSKKEGLQTQPPATPVPQTDTV